MQVDTLTKEKHDRLKKLKSFSTVDQHLCDVLCSTPYYIPTGSIPTPEQLVELEEHVKKLEVEKVRFK